MTRTAGTMEHIDYHGWKDSIRLSNGTTELVVLTAVGPRIIHYSAIGGPNAFNVISKFEGQTGGDAWVPYGGHRLWVAPEANPRSYHPDTGPVGSTKLEGNTLTITNPAESSTGIEKEVQITLASEGSAVRVVHKVTNRNIWPVTLAPWALSIVANGGRVVLPQEPFVSHDDDLLPARPLVLWKFTEMGDPRWRWGSKYITLRQDDNIASPQKVGLYNAQGWGAHVTPSQVFVVRIDVAPGGPSVLTDQGCNFETYTEGPFQELETLGAVVTLEPGESATHTQYWSLIASSEIADDDASLDAALLPIVQQAQQETTAAFG